MTEEVATSAIQSGAKDGPRIGAKTGAVVRGAAIVFAGNTLAMGLGFAVTIVAATRFGSSTELDAFLIVAPLPLMAGQFALSIALVALSPYYQRQITIRGVAEAQKSVQQIMWLAILFAIVLACVSVVFAREFAEVLAPGFDSVRLDRVVTFLRIAALGAPFLVGMSFTQTFVNAHGLFMRGALSRAIINAVGLCALVFLGSLSLVGAGAAGYFAGFSIAAALSFSWQYMEVRSISAAPIASLVSMSQLRTTWRDIRKSFAWIGLARFLGHSGEVLLLMIASLVGVGVIASYSLAYRLAAIPLLLAGSLALALFPAQAWAETLDNAERRTDLFWRGLSAFVLLGAGFGALLFSLADHLTIFFYEHGKMIPSVSFQIVLTLRVLALGLFAVAANNAIANLFWASGRLKERVFIEAIAVSILLSGAWFLGARWGAPGMAGAYILEFTFLFFVGGGIALRSFGVFARGLGDTVRILAVGAVVSVLVGALLMAPEKFRALDHWGQGWRLTLEVAGIGVALVCGMLAMKVGIAKEACRRVWVQLTGLTGQRGAS